MSEEADKALVQRLVLDSATWNSWARTLADYAVASNSEQEMTATLTWLEKNHQRSRSDVCSEIMDENVARSIQLTKNDNKRVNKCGLKVAHCLLHAYRHCFLKNCFSRADGSIRAGFLQVAHL